MAVSIEALILLLLLTLGREVRPGVDDERRTLVSFIPAEISQEAHEAAPEQQAESRPEAQRPQPEQPRPPQPAQPAAPPAAPAAPPIMPMRWELTPSAALPRNTAPPAMPLYGPADNRSPALRDTERVGTAPNGEPLYAAQWYREPAADMMRAYLSTARGPGWGLIACRTAPDYRVEDCVALGEYPEGSQIDRSALAAAWEFRVRPPHRGGRPLVGSWVRIRIDYGLGRH